MLADCQQMEHRTHRPHDVFPRGRRQHAGAPRPARQVREQDPDAYQDRPQLEDAEPLSARRLLHPEGARRPRDAVDGPRPHPAVRPQVVKADGRRNHPLPLGDES